MINAVTAAQAVAVVKNFVKNTIHVLMRIKFGDIQLCII